MPLETEHDIATTPAVVPEKTLPPPLYKVLLLNDDYTTMPFVITVLQRFFSHNMEDATQIMLEIHHQGRGVCGIYPKDIAVSKVAQVAAYARAHQHPLACVIEEN